MKGLGFSRCAIPTYPPQTILICAWLFSAAFLDIIAGLLPSNVHSHFNKRCTGVSDVHGERVRLRFADDSEHEVDLVIGADGIKSAIRAQGMHPHSHAARKCLTTLIVVFGSEGDRLVNTGTSAYRALVPTERLRAAGIKEELLKPIPRGYLGQDKVYIPFNVIVY